MCIELVTIRAFEVRMHMNLLCIDIRESKRLRSQIIYLNKRLIYYMYMVYVIICIYCYLLLWEGKLHKSRTRVSKLMSSSFNINIKFCVNILTIHNGSSACFILYHFFNSLTARSSIDWWSDRLKETRSVNFYIVRVTIIKYYLFSKRGEGEGRARTLTCARKRLSPSVVCPFIILSFLISPLNIVKARRRITDAPATPATPVTVDNSDGADIRLECFLKNFAINPNRTIYTKSICKQYVKCLIVGKKIHCIMWITQLNIFMQINIY